MEFRRGITIFFMIVSIAYITREVPKIYTSFLKIDKLNGELNSLKLKKQSLKDEIVRYKIATEHLKDDFYKEKIVREKLKMVKPGEKIYKVLVK